MKSGGPDFGFDDDDDVAATGVGFGAKEEVEVDDGPNAEVAEAAKADGAPKADCPPPPPKGELDGVVAPNADPALFPNTEVAGAGARAPNADVGAGVELGCAPNAEVAGC